MNSLNSYSQSNTNIMLSVWGMWLIVILAAYWASPDVNKDNPPEKEEKAHTEALIEPEPYFEVEEPPTEPNPPPETLKNRNLDVSEAGRRCLEANIYYEARNQSLSGMMGVGLVTLNRVEDSRWGDDVCSVVSEPWQFSWTQKDYPEYPDPDNPVDEKALEKIKLVVSFLLSGGANFVVHVAQDAVFFHNPSLVDWKYADSYEELGDVGDHRFYA